MRSIIREKYFAVLGALLLHCGAAVALTGADWADVTVQRYTVAVANSTVRCSGVVLAQDLVLTAAHCVKDAENLWVGGNRGLGELTRPPIGLSPVAKVITHPDFVHGRSDTPDLAILKLTEPLPSRFLPVSLDARLADNDAVIAAGYGKNAEDDPGGTILRMALLQIVKIDDDYLTLASAQGNPTVGGPGDSGSPVFSYRGMHGLAGIIVSGFASHAFAVPIGPNYGWIKRTIESLSSASP